MNKIMLHKVLHPCNIRPEWTMKGYPVFIKVEYVQKIGKTGRLSITGVEGPTRSGNARGSCGQITIDFTEITKYAPGWDKEKLSKLVDVWDKWHLNDMHAECEHQEAAGITYRSIPDHVCKECGYKIGSAWTSREVPKDVLDWLESLPDTDIEPAWV